MCTDLNKFKTRSDFEPLLSLSISSTTDTVKTFGNSAAKI
jgi:hypothetical protein